MKKINEIIKYYIQKKSIHEFLTNIIYLILVSIIILVLFIFFESIFFITQNNKLLIISFFLPIILTLLFYILTKFTLQYFSLFKVNNKFNIAADIGNEFSAIKDHLLNVLQIKKQKNDSNLDLKNYAVKNLFSKLQKIVKTKIKFNFPIPLLGLMIIAMFLISIVANDSLKKATYRIINYNTRFDPPTPFVLVSSNQNINILSSDSLEIEIKGTGDLPDTIIFNWIENNINKKKKIGINNNKYKFQFDKVSSNIIYWADYTNKKIFSSWDKISTKEYLINVKQRPVIEKLSFTIVPPIYTMQSEKKYDMKNNNQINILKGSKVIFYASTNKLLDSSWILNDKKERINLNTNKNEITGELDITENMFFTIHCLDNKLSPNLSIKQYNFITDTDIKPNITIQSPNNNFTIDESMVIPIIANISDDYGLTDVFINYKIVSNDFPEFNDSNNQFILEFDKLNNKSANINLNWDIQNISISMGDELHFKIIARDNNSYDGYQVSESDFLIGKFPDIEDLFLEIDNLEEETEDIIDDIESSLEEISNIAEDLKMELLKSDQPSWEQEQKIEETFEEINDISDKIEKIQDNIDEILEKADKNQLFSEELMNKFEKFQDLLGSVMSEELFDSMQNLQDALKEFDMEKITEALDNFNFNVEQFEEQIDRYINMFETAMAEQKLNELYEHMENIIEKQNNLIEEIQNNRDEYVLNKKSTKQEKRYQDFKNLLDEATSSLKSINNNTSKSLESLSADPIINDTNDILQKQTESIGKDDLNKTTKAAKNNMQNISNMISEVQSQFQNEITKKLTKEFIAIIDNLLTVTNLQEELIDKSKKVRSNSPTIKIINRQQDNINRQLNQITKQLINLSNNTFFVNPQINRLIGKLKSSISDAISNFEQKKISNGKKGQANALKNLNTITYLLLLSMEEMQSSNSPSGYEKFMESLEKMSGQQQGINQGTMELGQFGMMQQKSMMQQLLEQQQQLQQQLEQLIGDNPGQETGGLTKANEDMEEVVLDFINNNISRETYDRQQKILSRMLDSQKSLTKKDYSEKRKSKVSNDFNLSTTNTIPDNYGEKDLFYIKAMEDALNQNLSKEYAKMTRIYFLNLQEEIVNE